MWPRAIELMLGCWLLASPFIFRFDAGDTDLWVNAFAAGGAVVVLSLLTFWHRLRRIHLGAVAVGLYLVLYGWLQARPLAPGHQNEILVGLVLAMFALIPRRAMRPPVSWRGPC